MDKTTDKFGDLLELLEFDRLFFLICGIIVLIFIVRTIYRTSESLGQRFNDKRLFILQISTILTFSFYVLGIPLIIYVSLRPPKEMLLALGGSMAVAIGLGAKDILASFFAGIVLLFDKPMQVGDRVTIGDVYGEVKSIGLRAVRLVTLDDNVVTIPNIKLITENVSSGNFGALDMMIEVHFRTALDENIGKIKSLLYEIVVTSRFAYLSKPVVILVKEVEVAHRLALEFKVKAYVLDVIYEKAFETDIVTRASKVFSDYEIRRPML